MRKLFLFLFLTVACIGLFDSSLMADEPSNGDTVTIGGQMWQKQPAPEQLNLGEARSYCEKLSLGGHDDWKLPSISQLRSIIVGCDKTHTGGICGVTDECLTSNPCSKDGCRGCSSNQGPAGGCYWPEALEGTCGRYWSSSPMTSYENTAWYVIFNYAFISFDNQENKKFVRCVRGAHQEGAG